MIESNVLRVLYSGITTDIEFCYDNLIGPPLLSLLTVQDIYQLKDTAMSLSLSANINKKYEIIDNIMKSRNFKRLAGGTNRLVYRHLEIQGIVVKVAIDQEGMSNNPDEFKNQDLIKPFCCKVFDVSPCGTVGVFERVDRITSRYEYVSIAEDIYEMITNKLVGKYVLEDIGTKFMYNWGIRKGFGPVLLDFPYIYELDGSKLSCNTRLDDGSICGGEVDYDEGFNFLSCKKCGTSYRAKELSKPKDKSGICVLAKQKGAVGMKIAIMRGNEVVKEVSYKDSSEYMKKDTEKTKKRKRVITNPQNIKTEPVITTVYGKKPMREVRSEYYRKHNNDRAKTVYSSDPVQKKTNTGGGVFAFSRTIEKEKNEKEFDNIVKVDRVDDTESVKTNSFAPTNFNLSVDESEFVPVDPVFKSNIEERQFNPIVESEDSNNKDVNKEFDLMDLDLHDLFKIYKAVCNNISENPDTDNKKPIMSNYIDAIVSVYGEDMTDDELKVFREKLISAYSPFEEKCITSEDNVVFPEDVEVIDSSVITKDHITNEEAIEEVPIVDVDDEKNITDEDITITKISPSKAQKRRSVRFDTIFYEGGKDNVNDR